MPDFVFDARRGHYRFKPSGRIVPQSRIDAIVARVSTETGNRLRGLAESYRAGSLSLAEWATSSQDQIRAAHRAVGMVAAGGRGRMGAREWGFVGARLRSELEYFRVFTNSVDGLDIATLGDGFVARASNYGNAVYATHSQAVTRRHLKDGTASTETNVLDASAAHCDDCVAETAKGSVPLGTLTPIGRRSCVSGCRCRIDYT